MDIIDIDHLVLTVADMEKSIDFYTHILPMRHEGRALFFGNHKINLHCRPREFSPAARHPIEGSGDFCLIIQDDIHDAVREITKCGGIIELGPVTRSGAQGEMQSIYLRDPDGNLVELASYSRR
ncbi:MAG: VOC family protein [Akkermansia sp.]